MVEYCDDGAGLDAPPGPPPSDAERLQAALEALSARDRVLADRTRRLAALEQAAARLAALSGRLEAAEEEIAALRRVRAAEAAEQEERTAQLERRLAGEPAAPEPPTPPAPAGAATGAEAGEPAGPGTLIAHLQRDLQLERQRNFRLNTRGGEGAAAEAARRQQALDDCRRENAALERQLADLRGEGLPSSGGAYARWEDWFRRRLAERHDAELRQAQEAVRLQHVVLEEKERLIATLLDRLRARGEVQEGPDDLKEIVGIGPVIEDLLHRLGITTFERLASLSEEETERIADLLGAFRDRIRRDGWTRQAAELARRRVRLGSGLSLR